MSRRQKFSRDPNNTAWTRHESSYGRRQLLAQGWQPGTTLGRANAAHAQYLTAASAAHIRVRVLDENQGLGAELKDEMESTGLGALQDLLGRLNGKGEDEREKEKEIRNSLKRKRVVQQRYGRTWVRGGYLQGSEMTIVSELQQAGEQLRSAPIESASPSKSAPPENAERKARRARKALKTKKKKKRKAAEPPPFDTSHRTAAGNVETVEKLPSLLTVAESKAAEPASLSSLPDKQKKKKKPSRKTGRVNPDLVTQDSDVAAVEAKIRDMRDGSTRTDSGSPEKLPSVQSSRVASALFSGGRNAVRRRYIEQKKMAMDPRALNEVSFRFQAELLAF